MGSNAAQLTAAVSALINALVASKFSTQGALGLMNTISYARWGLEGYVIAEANCLKGRCHWVRPSFVLCGAHMTTGSACCMHMRCTRG